MKVMTRMISRLVLLLLLYLSSTILMGQRTNFFWPPYTSLETSIDIYNDYNFSTKDKNEQVNDLYLEAKFNFYTYFTQHIYMFNSFTMEPVKDAEYGKNRTFEDIGLFWSNLSFNYETDQILVGVGRGSPNFSMGYAVAPGIWGSDDSYETLKTGGKWGATIAPNLSFLKFAELSLSASIFMADNTGLSDSYITRRGIFYRDYGGPSNTGNLNSYSFALDGTGISGIENLFFHVAYMKQKVSHLSFDLQNEVPKDSLADEQRIVASAFYIFELNEETNLTPFVEYGVIHNDVGLKGKTKRILTASVELNEGNWNHSLAYSSIGSMFAGNNTDPEYSLSVTTSYLFNSGIEASIGYKYANDNDNSYTHTAGASLSFTLNSRNNVLLGRDFLKLNVKKQLIVIARFAKMHSAITSKYTDDDSELLRSELVEYIKSHPNGLSRPLQSSILNIILAK